MQLTGIPRVAAVGEVATMRSTMQSLGMALDPCTTRRPVHSLTNTLAIALCAAVADYNSWEDIEDFGTHVKPGSRPSSRRPTASRRAIPFVESSPLSSRGPPTGAGSIY